MFTTKAIEQYLFKYAEPETEVVSAINDCWQFVICVPVCGEKPDCIARIFKKCNIKNVLMVLVVNHPDHHSRNVTWQAYNQQLIDGLVKKAENIYNLKPSISLLKFSLSADILLINRTGKKAIPAKKGVGLARKIAADCALGLIVNGCVENHWIFSTDADVCLPEGYFFIVNTVTSNDNVSAFCLPFVHMVGNPSWEIQQKLYDFKLYYYQAGIHYTGSCYDYIPLGSTLVVSAEAYAMVRGFPARNGAEDFYLLNKLCKVGDILQPQTAPIEITSRISDRVPFGTGPAISHLMGEETPEKIPLFYHPLCFYWLKKWRDCLMRYWYDRNFNTMSNEYLDGLTVYFNLEKVFGKSISRIKNIDRWQHFIHEWLDAFRLLKAVHYLSDFFPRLNILELIQTEAFKNLDGDDYLLGLFNHSIARNIPQ